MHLTLAKYPAPSRVGRFDQGIGVPMKKLISDRTAVTALEYGVIASILGLVLVTVFGSLGHTMTVLFTAVGAKI